MDRLSNVIGAPFDDYVITQLGIRQQKSSTSERSNEEVLYLANKSAWVRLISSVDVAVDTQSFYKSLNLDNTNTTYSLPQDLSKNWILEAGTSKYSSNNGIDLRYGLGPDGSYGLGGIDELGYRPMPGLTSVKIETAGKLGSLRYATIYFKVWNMNQLNVIEALYFRLGYSMLLEWGHTQYYNNTLSYDHLNHLVPVKNTFGLDDPFGLKSKLNTAVIQQQLSKNIKNSSANYDGMFGIVCNFAWAFNQEGGYDCNLKLIGKGSIMDTVRINQTYKFPDTLAQKYKDSLEILDNAEAEAEAKAKEKPVETTKPISSLQVPKNPHELWQNIYIPLNPASATTNHLDEPDFVTHITTYRPSSDYLGRDSIVDYYYEANGNVDNLEEINKYVGYFLNVPDENSFNLIAKNRSSSNGASKMTLLPDEINKFVNAYLNYAPNNGGITEELKNINLNLNYYHSINNFDYENLLKENTFAALLDNQLLKNSNNSNNYKITNPSSILQLSPSTFQTIVDNISPLFAAAISVYSKNSSITSANIQVSITINKVDTYILNTSFSWQTPKDYLQPSREDIVTAFAEFFSENISTNQTTNAINSITYPEFTISDLGSFVNNKNELYTIIGSKDSFQSTKVKYKVDYSKVNQKLTNLTDQPFILNSIKIEFNNIRLIGALNGETPNTPIIRTLKAANVPFGDPNSTKNTSTKQQEEAKKAFSSSLLFMLNYIKVITQAKNAGKTNNSPGQLDISPDTYVMYQSGILKNLLYLDKKGNANLYTPKTAPSGFDLTAYALKGFNSNLMVDPSLYDSVPSINIKDLFYSYIIPYNIDTQEEYPAYIPLGYLLAFINNMCLIYEGFSSNTNDGVFPYFYIDFNTETNLCLTCPQHLSVDPTVCFIPFEAATSDYYSLFPNNNSTTGSKPSIDNPVAPNITGPIWNPDNKENPLRQHFPTFKKENSNQGKTMSILLNIQHLIDRAESFTYSDKENTLYLQQFLQAIMDDVAAATGGLNSFRVAYRDDSNTIQILDDQFVPNLKLEVNSAINPNGSSIQELRKAYSELPVFGQQSIVRSMTFETNMSTKLSSMIAISARSDTNASVNSTDASSLTWLNKNFNDRYKPFITEASKNSASNSDKTSDNNDNTALELFNNIVRRVYLGGDLDSSGIESAKNSYREFISKIKSVGTVTTGALFIPANLSIIIDGIAGIVMGQAFTIPENRLPLSLRGTNGFTKVGFIVVGLHHTIENEQWTTEIIGQMIRLKQKVEYGKISNYIPVENTPYDTYGVSGDTSFKSENCTSQDPTDAKKAIKDYLGRDLSLDEFNHLIAVINGEAGEISSVEKAYVAGVILNRVRTNYENYGKDVISQITARSQFSSVKPGDKGFRVVSCSVAGQIYNAISKYLNSVPKNFKSFGSNKAEAYVVPGKRTKQDGEVYIQNFKTNNNVHGGEGKGWVIKGQSIFGVTSGSYKT